MESAHAVGASLWRELRDRPVGCSSPAHWSTAADVEMPAKASCPRFAPTLVGHFTSAREAERGRSDLPSATFRTRGANGAKADVLA